MIKSTQLEIMTLDAGASGRHSNAAHWNEELFVLFDKKRPHRHFMKLDCVNVIYRCLFQIRLNLNFYAQYLPIFQLNHSQPLLNSAS